MLAGGRFAGGRKRDCLFRHLYVSTASQTLPQASSGQTLRVPGLRRDAEHPGKRKIIEPQNWAPGWARSRPRSSRRLHRLKHLVLHSLAVQVARQALQSLREGLIAGTEGDAHVAVALEWARQPLSGQAAICVLTAIGSAKGLRG